MLNSLTLLRAMNGIYEEDVVMAGNSYFDEKQVKHLKTKRIISFALAAALLEGSEVQLGVDYLPDKARLDAMARRVVYTGPIDAYFGYQLGALEYRAVRFETEILDIPDFQGHAVINYTDRETPYTRVIEHKWFGKGGQPKTVISREYSAAWRPGCEPHYPVNDAANDALYAAYRRLADREPQVIFGGRLGEYRYYDMDAVIAAALAKSRQELA